MKELTKANVTVGELAIILRLDSWVGSAVYWKSLAKDEYNFMPAKAQTYFDKLPEGK